jgi:hypothetical protein
MKIIGITGKAGSGKDTVANHLVAQYGYRRGQFAYELKRMVCETFGWDRNQIDDLEYKEEIPLLQDGTPQCPGPLDGLDLPVFPGGMTRRQVLIHWGTNCMRYIDPDIHVKLTMRNFAADNRTSLVVFADLRFLNEAVAVRALGGEVWRVVKIGGPGTDEGSASNVSETEMDRIVPDLVLEAAHGQIPFLLSQADGFLGFVV